MSEMSANDARTHLIELLNRAEYGEESTISTGGDPTARIRPLTPVHNPEEARAAFARIRERVMLLGGSKASVEDIKSWIEEGRA